MYFQFLERARDRQTCEDRHHLVSWDKEGQKIKNYNVVVLLYLNKHANRLGTSLVVQWLRLRAPNAGGLGSIPDQGTRSCMPHLKIRHAVTKIEDATCHS